MTIMQKLMIMQYLDDLEITIEEFENFTEYDLKNHYLNLVRRYHPDWHSDNDYYLEKMKKTNNAMDNIKKLIKNGVIILKEKETDNKDYESSNKTDYKNINVRKIYNLLDNLYKKVNSSKKRITNTKQILIINYALELHEEILERINIVYSNNNSIYDYGIILNYAELFEYFYSNIGIVVDRDNTFDFKKSNHVKKPNDKYDNLNDKICLVHKQLLFNELKKIIKNYNGIEMYNEKVFQNIEEIDREIINLKWYLKLSTFEFNTFDERVKNLIKRRRVK